MRGDLPHRVNRVLQTGDLHLRTKQLDDQVPVLEWIAHTATTEAVDLVIVAGDISGRAAPHVARPAERNAYVAFLRSLAEAGIHVITIRGNHDVAADWEFLRAWRLPTLCEWVTVPETFAFQGGFCVHCLPYPDKSYIAGTARLNREEQARAIEGGLSALVDCWAAERPPGEHAIISGHFNTRGAVTSTGQPLIGQDVELPLDILHRAGAGGVFVNHIHKPQESGDVVHVGSPWSTDFGELESKRVVIYHVGAQEWESLDTPCLQLVSLDLHWQPEQREWSLADGQRWPGGLDHVSVRARLHYTEGDAIDRDAVRRMFDDTTELKLDPVPVRIRRERAPEVVSASDPKDRYVAFEAAEGREPDPRELDIVAALLDSEAVEWGCSAAAVLADGAAVPNPVPAEGQLPLLGG